MSFSKDDAGRKKYLENILFRTSLGKAKSYVRSISFLQMLNFLVIFFSSFEFPS